MARTTPVQRAVSLLEAEGWTVAKVCRWSRKLRKRARVLGFADLLALKAGRPALAVFLSSAAWGRAEVELGLLEELPACLLWLGAGGAVEVWAWAKRDNRWEVTRLPVGAKGKRAARFAA